MEHNIRIEGLKDEYRIKLKIQRPFVDAAKEQVAAYTLSAALQERLTEITRLAQSYQPSQGAPAAIYTLAQVTDRLVALMQPYQEIGRAHV